MREARTARLWYADRDAEAADAFIHGQAGFHGVIQRTQAGELR